MKINVKLDDGFGIMPTRAHEEDAGFDLYAPYAFDMAPHNERTIDTGVHFEIPKGYVGFIKSKSGLNVKYGIVAEGVIDAGYTGSVKVRLFRADEKPKWTDGYEIVKHFDKGDKITQIVFLPIPYVELNEVKELGEYDRGDNGFGSTGR